MEKALSLHHTQNIFFVFSLTSGLNDRICSAVDSSSLCSPLFVSDPSKVWLPEEELLNFHWKLTLSAGLALTLQRTETSMPAPAPYTLGRPGAQNGLSAWKHIEKLKLNVQYLYFY